MGPGSLTERKIRTSFLNATRRETGEAVLPDLADLPWDRLDHLGRRDRKAPLAAYVVLGPAGTPTGVLRRAAARQASGRSQRFVRDIAATG